MSEMLLIALAAASLWKLAVADRITRFLRYRWVRLARRSWMGWFGYHMEYVIGCALCFPVWASTALYVGRNVDLVRDLTVILAARFVAYGLLRVLQETATRDWPRPFEWPPPERGNRQ